MASFTLFTIAKFSPYEWVNPAPWKKTDYLVNNINVSNSFWFITGTLLRQASGVTPKVIAELSGQGTNKNNTFRLTYQNYTKIAFHNFFFNFKGTHKSTDKTIFFHEPIGNEHLALRPICLRAGLHHDVRSCKIFTLRVAQSAPL